jgi:hypothetical protein
VSIIRISKFNNNYQAEKEKKNRKKRIQRTSAYLGDEE